MRTKDLREIPMLSKYSAFVVGTRRINLIFMSKKFSVPLTSESVTSGQAGGVFRQLFFQWGGEARNVQLNLWLAWVWLRSEGLLIVVKQSKRKQIKN